jgi:hypothetical protein
MHREVLVADDGHLYFLPDTSGLTPNRRVRISGTLAGGQLAPQSIAPASDPAPENAVAAATAAGPAASGTTRVLVMLTYWTAPDAVTPQSAAAQMFGDSNAWYRDNSYGALGQTGDVTPWMRIDPPVGNQCYADSDHIMTQAKSSAAAAGFDVASYDNVVVYFPYDGDPGSDCSGYAGWAVVAGQGTWLNGYMDRRATVHEQGHNYGLWHAHSLLCAGRIDDTCQFTEYGNDYDAMGASTYVGHFSASQKAKLGWMSGRVQDLTGGGTTTLAPYETDTPATVAAVVDASADRSYWFEYRQPRDDDADLPPTATDGVMVTMKDATGPVTDDGDSILDTRPGDGLSVSSATLRAGETWTTDEGFRIAVESVTAAGATISVTRSTGQVTGIVRDGRGVAMRGARVSIGHDADEVSAVTDTSGRYTIPNVAPGTYDVRAAHICAASDEIATIVDDGPSTVDFRLAPATGFAACVVDTPAWDTLTDALSVGGDDASQTVTLPFAYDLDGLRATTASISTNGNLNFLGPSVEWDNTQLPNPATPNAALYPFWDDLQVDGSARVLTGTFGVAPHRRFVVEWRNVAFIADPSHRISLQAVLYEDPTEAVRFQYRDIDGSSLESGSDATIGTEDATGTAAIQASYDAGLVYDGLSIRLGGHTSPRVSIGDAAAPEGASGRRSLRFTVTLSSPARGDVAVPYRTVPGTATRDIDFAPRVGTAVIPAGASTTTIPVAVIGDRRPEPTERFTVALGRPVGAELGRDIGVGRIIDDDPSVGRLAGVGDAATVEGDAGTPSMTFTIALSAPARVPVSVRYTTLDGTARAGADFASRSGVAVVPRGATTAVVAVPIRPDTVAEPDELFVVRLAGSRGAAIGRSIGFGRIVDDD